MFLPLMGPNRYKGARGGRGSGKSHALAEMLVERCLMTKGLRAVCVREVQKSLSQSVKRLVEDKIQKFGVGGAFDVQRDQIKTPGDGLIIFQGMQNHTADSIKSLEGYDVAWVEEAQSLSQRSLDLLRPTIRKTGSELWFSWNPDKPTDPVDKFFRGDQPPPDSVCVEANWNDNPWFPEVLRQEKDYDQRRDPDKYAWVWGGQYCKRSEARVFSNWRIEEFETFADARFYFGADWGFSIDPTVLIRSYIIGRNLYIDAEAYSVGCEIDATPALFDKIDPARPMMARQWPIKADSARPETISYMKRNGYPHITPAKKGPNSVMDGIEFLRSHDIIVHPRCRHVIDELTLYSFKTDEKTGEVIPVLEDKENHTIDALRYALEGLRRSPVMTFAAPEIING